MKTHCEYCGNELTANQKKESIKAETKKFWDESVIKEAKMIPYNDAFYEIVSGKYIGNLVHIWNLVK